MAYTVYKGSTGVYYVTDGHQFYPASGKRLTQAAKSQRFGLRIRSLRSPRKAIITKGAKSIEMDRLWPLDKCLQETAEVLYRLQHLDRNGKVKYYKELGL